jgi:hypothetical protein
MVVRRIFMILANQLLASQALAQQAAYDQNLPPYINFKVQRAYLTEQAIW